MEKPLISKDYHFAFYVLDSAAYYKIPTPLNLNEDIIEELCTKYESGCEDTINKVHSIKMDLDYWEMLLRSAREHFVEIENEEYDPLGLEELLASETCDEEADFKCKEGRE